MSLKKQIPMSWAGNYVDARLKKNTFLKQINIIIDWAPIEKELLKVCKRSLVDAAGRPAYNPVVLFKMMLLQTWYNLSDEGVEDMVNDSLSAMTFCNFEIEDTTPDHSTISRFRKELTEKKAMDRILKKFNIQLQKHGIMVKTGTAKVDASITDSPLYPKGKTTYEIAEDRKEDQRDDQDIEKEKIQHRLIKQNQPGADSEGRWLKKGGKTHFGFKKHIATDENGLVLAVHSTTANEHDSKGLQPLLNKMTKAQMKNGVFTDKGYKSKANDEIIKSKHAKNRVQYKAYRNKPLTHWQVAFNKLVSKKRYVVERTFGGMKRWFGAGVTRYKGISKTHTQHVMEAIAYNLKRSPGIIVSNC